MRIDLNCDMGESFGTYRLGMDAEVIRHITSANVACGWHAGDPAVMDRTVSMAKELSVGIGAHHGDLPAVADGIGPVAKHEAPHAARHPMILAALRVAEGDSHEQAER